MLIPENDSSQPQQPNEKLCWKKYRYCATSCSYMLYGTVELEVLSTRDQLTERMIETVAYHAARRGHKWNVFNMNIVLKGV